MMGQMVINEQRRERGKQSDFIVRQSLYLG